MRSNFTPTKPEIMSPVGYWPQLHAAVEAGADAVYFGLKHFTARAKVGFGLDELPEVMRTLHLRGVRGYITFNTLVFDHEIDEAARSLAAIAAAGADAIIVQDVAVAQIAHRLAPDLEIHGSTQMSITSAEGIHLAQQFGVCRVVLARELSLDEIRKIRRQTACELEMFVHGALCVSYSGQCFSSEAWGGRSANRGQCAQACRLPYELIVDDMLKPLGDARYLLSPGDLYALHQMPEIVQLGVSALKIEGRYKDANYVALTTAAYRKAVDEAWAGLPLSIEPAEELQLAQVYSRGLGPYFVAGTDHQSVVRGRSPRHRGLLMGRVTHILDGGVIIAPESSTAAAPLKPGDGLVFDAADWRSPEAPEEGGRVYQVIPAHKGRLELRFANRAVDFGRIRPGDLVWRTDDPDLERAAKPYTQAAAPVHKQPIWMRVTADEGAHLVVECALAEHPETRSVVYSDEPLPPAQAHALTLDFVREQMSRLGNTPYELDSLDLDLRGSPFAPASLLNRLRRQAIDLLAEKQGDLRPITLHDPLATVAAWRAESMATPAPHIAPIAPQLHLLVRTPEQLDAALDTANSLAVASITLDYLDLYGLRPAVERIQAAAIAARVASPRVLKPDEQRIVNFLLRLGCPILVRSGGLLQALNEEATHPPLTGDFSLNASNELSARLYLRLGLERLTPTHDLNAAQVTALAHSVGAGSLEVVAYHHLPVFHTEHCVFCRFLSTGTSYKDCGHPCEKHKLALRDATGRAHPVMADVGCRNTVFGAQAQEAARYLDDWQRAGILHYRLEFVHETGDEVTQVTRAFSAALSRHISSQELSRRLARSAPQGTTAGSLFVPENYLEIPLLQ